MAVIVTVIDASGRGESIAISDDVFRDVLADHHRACRDRRELVDRRVTAAAHLAGIETHRAPLGTDFDADLDSPPLAGDAAGVCSSPTPPPTRETALMTYQEAAMELRVHRSTIQQMVGDGRLDRVGERRGARITRASVEAYAKGDRQ